MSTPLGRLTADELRDHAPWLLRVARGLVTSESDAEDLAQDVWHELARGAGPIAHLRALSARIARRLAGQRRQAEHARGRREAGAARPEALPGPAELEGALDTQRLLLEEFTALDEIHRTPLMLHFYEGLSAAEIARRRGVPASTVRSQIQRALVELRARLDRRHGGERRLWIALVARLPRPEAAAGGLAVGGFLMTTVGKSLCVAVVLGVLAVTWRLVRPIDERPLPEVADAAAPSDVRPTPPAAESAAALDEPEATSTARSQADVAAQGRVVPPDVPVLVLDEATGLPLPEFELSLENGLAELPLTTDARGRASIPAPWFEAAFRLDLVGDREFQHSYGVRELGPVDRPEPGTELVLRCATGPTYSLLFDAPPPAAAELVAGLSAGSGPPVEPSFTASVHRGGARVWTRFAPAREELDALGDGPWTLTVFAQDGLWRAHGPVRTIVAEQREPVLLTSQVCGALHVELECDVAPQEGGFNLSLYHIVENEGVEPWYEWLHEMQRDCHFLHLIPGEYQVWAGSPVHETAGARVAIEAGASANVRLALAAQADVAALRVVITSQSGTFDLGGVGAVARELGGNGWKHGTWSSKASTATRRVLLFEGLALADHEVALNGLGQLGSMGFAPGRSVLARPGAAELVFTLLDSGAPPPRTGRVQVLTRAGEPIEGAGVTTYFEGWGSFQHRTDGQGATQLESIMEGVRLDLLVLADGFRPKYLRDLALPFDRGVCDVRLDPGWGAWLDVVLARDSGSNDALHPVRAAGASVHVDGVFVGQLDERGQILLQGEVAPTRIAIGFPGYHVAYGGIDPVSGAPTPGGEIPLFVVLEPDPAAEQR